jgi:hypothetical protein
LSATYALISAAKTGALIGAVGGLVPLIVGLCGRRPRKALIGLSACLLAGALGGTYAVIPVSVASLLAVIRAERKPPITETTGDLVFKYSRPLVWLTFIGLPVIALLSIILLGAAIFVFIRSDVGFAVMLQAAFVGLLGVAFGWIAGLSARNWYVLLSEFALTDQGITIRYRTSLQFVAWGSLVSAKYRRAFGQIDLEFQGLTRRVILSNVDLDPQREKVSRALALVEAVSGHPVPKSIL